MSGRRSRRGYLSATALAVAVSFAAVPPTAPGEQIQLSAPAWERHMRVLGMPPTASDEERQRALREWVVTQLLSGAARAQGLEADAGFARLWPVERQAAAVRVLLATRHQQAHTAPERFYRLHRLLVRVRHPNGRPVADSAAALSQARDLAADLRQGRLLPDQARSLTGVEAVAGEWLAEGLASPGVRWAVERQADPAPLWRLRQPSGLFAQPSHDAALLRDLPPAAIVADRDAPAPPGWRAVRWLQTQGYLPAPWLEQLAAEHGVSHPVRTSEGWLVVIPLDQRRLGPGEHAQRLGSDAAARVRAQGQWQSLAQQRIRDWHDQVRQRHGLPPAAAPQPGLPPFAAPQAVLHRHGEWRLTAADFTAYAAWLEYRHRKPIADIEPDRDALYARFLQHAVLAHEAAHVLERDQLQAQAHWQRQLLLAELYRRRHWDEASDDSATRSRRYRQREDELLESRGLTPLTMP